MTTKPSIPNHTSTPADSNTKAATATGSKTTTRSNPKVSAGPQPTPTQTSPSPSKSPKRPRRKITKYDILFTIFVIVWAALIIIASQYIASWVIVILGNLIRNITPNFSGNFLMLIYYIIAYAIAIPLVIFVPPAIAKHFRKRSKQKTLNQAVTDLTTTPTGMGLQHLPTFVDIGLAPIGYIISAFIATILTNFMSVFKWFDPNQAQDVGFGYFITDLDRIVAMLGIVFIAPIAEEIIMRGWLYGKVRRKWSAPIATILISLVFAALHGQWNVGVSVFALSIVLCSLREITGTIWSSILLHMLSNAIAFYMLYIAI